MRTKRLSWGWWVLIVFIVLTVFVWLANQSLQPKSHGSSSPDPIGLVG